MGSHGLSTRRLRARDNSGWKIERRRGAGGVRPHRIYPDDPIESKGNPADLGSKHGIDASGAESVLSRRWYSGRCITRPMSI